MKNLFCIALLITLLFSCKKETTKIDTIIINQPEEIQDYIADLRSILEQL